MALGVQLGVGLGDVMLFLFVRGEILDLGRDDGADLEGLGLLPLELRDGFVGELVAGLEDDLAILADEVDAGLMRCDRRVIPGDRPLDLAVRASR
jgi:hypothetical protein